MPASFAGTCYADAAAALAAQCRNDYPQAGSSELATWVISCTGTDESVLNLQRTTDGGAPVDYSVAVTYADCNPAAIGASPISPGQAGQAFSWGFVMVVSVYLVAWGCGRVLDMIGRR